MNLPLLADQVEALQGCKVIDVSSFLAGPFCSTQLAEFGADVIKLELPGVDHSQIVMKLAAPFARDGRVREAMLSFLARTAAPSAPVQAPGR